MTNNCKWLSDEFSYICCNADVIETVSNWCPYSEHSYLNDGDLRDQAVFCEGYEKKENDGDQQ